jgi:signal transduction histidine kinase
MSGIAIKKGFAAWPAGNGRMASRIRAFDWARTPLGPITAWPPALRVLVQLMLAHDYPSCICVGRQGTLIYNDDYAAMIGQKHPAALGESVHIAFAEVSFSRIFARAMAGETTSLMDELMPFMRNGVMEQAWFDISYIPARDETGAVFGVFFFIKETTARVVAEKTRDELRERQGFLLKFSDTIRSLTEPDLIATTATRMVFDYFDVDRCFISLLEPEVGKAWLEHETRKPGLASVEGEIDLADFPESMRKIETETLIFRDIQMDPELSALDKAALSAMQAGALLAAMLRKGERNCFWDIVITTRDPRNWSVSDALILEEIAERTWAAIERARIETALRETEKLAAVGRLASSIAHEINNPLEAVTNLLYLIERTPLTPDAAHYLELAQAELRRVSGITIETLRFSRQNTEATAAKLSDVIESVVSLHDGRLKGARVTVERQYKDHSALICFPNELRQVVVNLVGNAIDSMSGFDSPRLRLRVRDARDPLTGIAGVRLTIADTGSGMSPATLRRIWEPFFTTKGSTGTGLGLWVTQEIIRKHQGTVWIRTSLGSRHHGSVFSVFLPHPIAEENGGKPRIASVSFQG